MSFWLSNAFNGISFGMLLFLLASGLTLALGLLKIINLAHGSFYLLGSYVGVSIATYIGNFYLAVVIGATAIGILGLVLERALLRRYAIGETEQVLLTFGCLFFFADLALYIWGGHPLYISSPDYFQQSIELGDTTVSIYKIIIIALGTVVAILLWLLQERTRYGAIIRAGVEDEQMTEGMGINITFTKSLVFALGALLAGLAGVAGGIFIGAYPGIDMEVLLLSLIIVVIGGAGSLKGALIGALLIGLVRNFSVAFIPQFSLAIIYVPMVIVLILRPQGAFWKKMKRRTLYLVIGAVLVIICALPWFLPPYYVSLLTVALIYGIFAMSLDILMGYAGLASLGHATFFGTSAYIVAILNVRLFQQGGLTEFGIELMSGLSGAIIVAAIIGLLVLHTRGIYFLMLTMALSMLLWGVTYKWYDVTGGSDGIPGISRPNLPLDISTGIGFFYFTLIFFVIACILMYLIVNSSFGRALLGIKQNELRMRSLGYNVWLYLYVAHLFAGLFAGLSGILFAYYNFFVSPINFHLVTSAEAVLMTILGGVGTLFGPLLGAAIIIFLKDIISSISERWVMVLGILYILVIVFIHRGIYGSFSERYRRGNLLRFFIETQKAKGGKQDNEG